MFKFLKKQKKEPKDLKEVLNSFRGLKENFEKLSQEIEKIKKDQVLSVQKISIVRFNPFSEVGSDQSFSIAILDGNNDGVVVSSLFTRNDDRVYGKPVKAGTSEYQLSEEEKTVIKKAIDQNNGKQNNN